MNAHNNVFNIHSARRLEDIKLGGLLEEAALQRGKDLHLMELRMSLLATAKGGSRLQNEMDIILASAEGVIEKAIAIHKELAAKAPEMLAPFPCLKDFREKLDRIADGAMISFRMHHEHPARKLATGASDASVGNLARKILQLKSRINRQIQEMALEGTLGMHQDPQHVTNLNISHSTIANLNLGTVVGDLNSSIQVLTTGCHNQLGEALRQLTEAIGSSSELADTDKKEVLENLACVSEQAALSTENRKLGPLRASWSAIKNGIGTAKDLVDLALKVEDALKEAGVISFPKP
jgi:hypothetical protein